MKRDLYKKLLLWKKQTKRQPLILRGARQVGKTSLIEQFGNEFTRIHIFNFQKNIQLREGFRGNSDPEKIIEFLEIKSGVKIDLKKDLIFFDEIQDCPEALNSLKYFSEDHPEIFLVSAGSLLGVYLSSHSFPVGKVQFLDLYPLSFAEYLRAIKKDKLAAKLESLNVDNNKYHEDFVEELKKYFTIGGMPKAVLTYIETKDYQRVREIQENLIIGYRSDFAKYSGPAEAMKILSVFENIPKQLAKDNRKFQFKLLKTGARYTHFSMAIDWLVAAGLCYKIPIIDHAEVPLKPYVDENSFKLYFFDVGLLAAHSDLPVLSFLRESNLFKTFKGAFVENYFLQEFNAHRREEMYCWQGKSSEVDFLYCNEKSELVPVEVKSGESGKLKSLQFFAEKYQCPWKIRSSMLPIEIRKDTKLKSIPLQYASLV